MRSDARHDATILHADLDSFYASVEQRDDPRLRGRPVAVGGGIILAASYEAKAFGVRTPMSGRDARALCPGLRIVSARMSAYSAASKDVFAIFDETTPIVEGLSVDEAFLDVAGLRRLAGAPADIAARLRARVLDEVGLPITVGIARTKFLAKVASAVAKPDGLLVVHPDTELEFLHGLPVERLWGVGPVTTKALHARGITRVAEVAALPVEVLVGMLGPAAGRHIHALAHNRDPRPVEVGRRRRSIGAQHAIGWRDHSRADVEITLLALVDRVARRLRAAHRVARTVVLRMRFSDFGRATRSATLPHPTQRSDLLEATACALLAQAWPMLQERGVTLVGVALSNLDDDAAVQLPLPFGERADHTLDATLDSLRDRFGSTAVTRAAEIGRHRGVAVPILPD